MLRSHGAWVRTPVPAVPLTRSYVALTIPRRLLTTEAGRAVRRVAPADGRLGARNPREPGVRPARRALPLGLAVAGDRTAHAERACHDRRPERQRARRRTAPRQRPLLQHRRRAAVRLRQ